MHTSQKPKTLKDSRPSLRKLYEVERLTLREIADRLGVTKQAVHAHLKAAGVALRPNGTRPKYRPKVLDRTILEDLYIAKRLSARAVAEQLGSHQKLV